MGWDEGQEYPTCDNCGKVQGEDDWFTGRGAHWWCSGCATLVERHEEMRGNVFLECPHCGWHLVGHITGGSSTRDRDMPDSHSATETLGELEGGLSKVDEAMERVPTRIATKCRGRRGDGGGDGGGERCLTRPCWKDSRG